MESAVGFVTAAGRTSFSYFAHVSVARLSSVARLMQGTRQAVRAIPTMNFMIGAQASIKRMGGNSAMTRHPAARDGRIRFTRKAKRPDLTQCRAAWISGAK